MGHYKHQLSQLCTIRISDYLCFVLIIVIALQQHQLMYLNCVGGQCFITYAPFKVICLYGFTCLSLTIH